MTRWNDPDETEGRRIYRATAEAVARRDMAMARHRPRISANVRAEQELQRERRLALEWCRENGNPHLDPVGRDRQLVEVRS
jgi:predicted ATPase